jgi:hypothetical protein
MAKILNLRPQDTKNWMINGDMSIWQRATAKTGITTGGYFTADRFSLGTTSLGTWTMQQSTDVPTFAQSGYQNKYSLHLLCTTGGSVVSGTLVQINQGVEGTNFASFKNGYVTLSYWIKCSLAGTYSVALRNFDDSRSYIAPFTIAASEVGTWVQKSLTVNLAAETTANSASWKTDISRGLTVAWNFAVGSTYQAPTANVWAAGTYAGTSANTSLVVTNAEVKIAQVMLNSGMIAAPFTLYARNADEELRACQRYFEKSYDIGAAPGTASNGGQFYWHAVTSTGGGTWHVSLQFKATKRNAAAVNVYSPVTGTINTVRNNSTTSDLSAQAASQGDTGCIVQLNTAPTAGHQLGFQWSADAEL